MHRDPQPTSGAELVNLRKTHGVLQADVARRLGVGRLTIHRWERSAEVDAIRAAKYRRAVDELYRAAVA